VGAGVGGDDAIGSGVGAGVGGDDAIGSGIGAGVGGDDEIESGVRAGVEGDAIGSGVGTGGVSVADLIGSAAGEALRANEIGSAVVPCTSVWVNARVTDIARRGRR
jgi:hypothetical protein